MKKSLKMSKGEIKQKEKEFRKTYFGKEYWNGLIFIDGICLLFLVLSFIESWNDYDYTALDSFNSWMLYLICLSIICVLRFLYNFKFEEYLESEPEVTETKSTRGRKPKK